MDSFAVERTSESCALMLLKQKHQKPRSLEASFLKVLAKLGRVIVDCPCSFERMAGQLQAEGRDFSDQLQAMPPTVLHRDTCMAADFRWLDHMITGQMISKSTVRGGGTRSCSPHDQHSKMWNVALRR